MKTLELVFKRIIGRNVFGATKRENIEIYSKKMIL